MTQANTIYTSSELHEFLQTRQSIRHFRQEPVSHKLVNRILDTTRFAPSAHNRQPWRFAVVQTEEYKEKLSRAMGEEFRRDLQADGLAKELIEKQVSRSYQRVMQTPVVIILCLTMSDMDRYPDRKRSRAEFRMAMQSVALAGGQMQLAAHAEGLGSVWVCAPLFAQSVVQSALELPADWEPQGMILIGYPESYPKPRSRKSVEEVSIFR